MKRYFIVNPSSSSNNGKLLWDRIKKYLSDNNIDCEIFITENKYDATKFAYDITSTDNDNQKLLVVFGGDGTLNEVLNGIVYFDNLMFCYIPSGSGNDFARGMNLKFDIETSMDSIVNPMLFKEIDYGVINYNNTTRRFIVSSGIGYDACICERVNSSKLKQYLNKVKLGKLSYLVFGVLQMIKLRLTSADITLSSGQKMHFDRLLFSSAHILPYEGGGFKFCPDANGSDDYIDICIAGNLSKLKMLFLIPIAKFGKHVGFKGINVYRCKTAEIKCNKKMAVHTDGETWEHTKNIIFACGTNKIKLVIY